MNSHKAYLLHGLINLQSGFLSIQYKGRVRHRSLVQQGHVLRETSLDWDSDKIMPGRTRPVPPEVQQASAPSEELGFRK